MRAASGSESELILTAAATTTKAALVRRVMQVYVMRELKRGTHYNEQICDELACEYVCVCLPLSWTR